MKIITLCITVIIGLIIIGSTIVAGIEAWKGRK